MALLERHPAKRFGFRVRVLGQSNSFARVKAQQTGMALQILERRIDSVEDLQEQAEWADALSLLNVRSRGRRQNTAAMIQGFASRND
jgi:predicted N-formylglutamate amidohydrolase